MIDQERNRIDMIKAQKINSVRQLSIDELYMKDLAKKKATF